MNNILLITPLYPLPTKENRITPVCHFFARDWTKMGYNVISIHLQPVHCGLWHLAVKIRGRNGSLTSYPKKLHKTEHYVMDDVPVFRIPIYQTTPHFEFTDKSVHVFAEEVKKELDKINFKPDIIVGHSMAPHIIPVLNEYYKVKTVMVAHGAGRQIRKLKNWEEIVDSYDAWGFRAEPIQKRFEQNAKKVRNSFICYSGIPEAFVATEPRSNFNQPLKRFVFVGSLFPNKYPIALLKAIPRVYNDFSIEIIGDGPDLEMLKEYVVNNGLKEHVSFVGKISREEVVKHLDYSDCFIMISGPEAFGLSYMEAMARGCITIGSKGQGIDGVIVDGENGFLCEVGNDEELTSILKKISNMDTQKVIEIAKNGYNTAKIMTDPEMARDYMNKLERV